MNNGINNNEMLSPQLLQSKFYLKITSILFIQPNNNKLTHEDIVNSIKHLTLFETILLALKS